MNILWHTNNIKAVVTSGDSASIAQHTYMGTQVKSLWEEEEFKEMKVFK